MAMEKTLRMTIKPKDIAAIFIPIALTGCASLSPDSTKERRYEPPEKIQSEPDGYEDPCFDTKKAKKLPQCPAYDPDRDYPLDDKSG